MVPTDLHQPAQRLWIRPWHKSLLALEVVTASTAVIGGLLLIAAPDGHLLRAGRSVLVGSPFEDWRVPGILLLTLVGVGFGVVAVAEWRNTWSARLLGAVGGAGLVLFESFEWLWLGFQPLQAVFLLVGAAVVLMSTARPIRVSARHVSHKP
jgi:hypothetical protein